jgi:carboxyl-terminal processing protease
VFDRVRADYVEDPDESKMIEAAINGMLASLDPPFQLYGCKRFEDMSVQTKGEFGGLGIEVTMENGFVKVVAPIDDTPCRQGGPHGQRLITKIDWRRIFKGLTLNEAVDKMRGGVKHPIVAHHPAQGPGRLRCESSVRDRIRVQSVKSNVEGDDIGYVRISSFTEQTQEGLDKAFTSMKSNDGRQGQGLHH